MKKLTIRVSDENYNRLNILSCDRKKSVNKIINDIVEEYLINQEYNLVDLEVFLKKIELKLETISKRQYIHYCVSLQEFANRCYSSNININDDKCLKEILDRKDKFNG